MRRLGVLGCALIASLIASPPAHAHVRSAGSGTAAVRVTAGLPLTVTPSPQTIRLTQGQGSLAGVLTNPNPFHRWGRPVPVTVTGTSNPNCKINQITVTSVAPPAAGVAVPPNGTRPWSVTVSGAGSNCRNAEVSLSYPTTQ